MRPMFPDARAFTLVEVMVVVALMSLAVTLAVTRLDGLTTRGRLESATRRLEAWFRMAMDDARTTGTPRTVVYAADPPRFTIRRPVEAVGGVWRWGNDQMFELIGGVCIDRVLLETPHGDGSSQEWQETTIRINGSGGFAAHAVILRAAGAWMVLDHMTPSESRIVEVQERPDAVTYDLLRLELALHVP